MGLIPAEFLHTCLAVNADAKAGGSVEIYLVKLGFSLSFVRIRATARSSCSEVPVSRTTRSVTPGGCRSCELTLIEAPESSA